jgi:hypothetical protein
MLLGASLRKTLFPVLVFAAVPLCGFADTYTYTYTGGTTDINQGADDTGLNPGYTYLNMGPISDNYTIPVGNVVTVALIGLEYPYASDLVVTLSLLNGADSVIASADLFNQIGVTGGNPAGDDTQFYDNYIFNSAYVNDLWTVAAPLGSSDIIPGDYYQPTTYGSDAVDNLSSAFSGLAINGDTWQLTITDYYLEFPDHEDAYAPSLESFSVSVDTDVPEPSLAIPFCLALAALLCVSFRLRSTCARTRRASARINAGESFSPGAIR